MTKITIPETTPEGEDEKARLRDLYEFAMEGFRSQFRRYEKLIETNQQYMTILVFILGLGLTAGGSVLGELLPHRHLFSVQVLGFSYVLWLLLATICFAILLKGLGISKVEHFPFGHEHVEYVQSQNQPTVHLSYSKQFMDDAAAIQRKADTRGDIITRGYRFLGASAICAIVCFGVYAWAHFDIQKRAMMALEEEKNTQSQTQDSKTESSPSGADNSAQAPAARSFTKGADVKKSSETSSEPASESKTKE